MQSNNRELKQVSRELWRCFQRSYSRMSNENHIREREQWVCSQASYTIDQKNTFEVEGCYRKKISENNPKKDIHWIDSHRSVETEWEMHSFLFISNQLGTDLPKSGWQCLNLNQTHCLWNTQRPGCRRASSATLWPLGDFYKSTCHNEGVIEERKERSWRPDRRERSKENWEKRTLVKGKEIIHLNNQSRIDEMNRTEQEKGTVNTASFRQNWAPAKGSNGWPRQYKKTHGQKNKYVENSARLVNYVFHRRFETRYVRVPSRNTPGWPSASTVI